MWEAAERRRANVAELGLALNKTDYWRSTRIFVVAVAAAELAVVAELAAAELAVELVVFVVVGLSFVADLQKDSKMTVVIFSKDETLFQRRRRPAGVETWWTTCCTAPLTWPAGCRADRDGPATEKSAISAFGKLKKIGFKY
jgi:hypothetical protein